MIDRDLVQRKIALIQDDLQHLTQYERLMIQDIGQDFKTQAIVERLLERTVGRALDINQHILAECGGHLTGVKHYRETFLRLADLKVYPLEFAQQIAKSTGLRNALVHEYNNLDPAILQKSIGQTIKEFNEYTEFILRSLDQLK